jgi:signal transduction histidine kinase
MFVKIDRQRMEFVLQTLLENALTYTPSGKNVDVIVSKVGHKAIISVVDHGIGIDKADMPRIFDKFFRADNARATDTEGFGVGLYLSQAIARRHKGTMDVTSDGVGFGSTFTITLKTVK